MPKHPPHRHGPHHPGPAGLHQIANRLQEMRELGASEDDIQAVLTLLKDKLPKDFAKGAAALDEVDEGAALARYAEVSNQSVLDFLRKSAILIAGEMKPHIIGPLMEEGLDVVQIHDATPHGNRPPHFRDLAGWYPGHFCGVLSFTEVKDAEFTALLIEVFLDGQGVAHASPLAMMASRLWPNAKLVAVISDHRAPHHVSRIGRDVDLFLYWE